MPDEPSLTPAKPVEAIASIASISRCIYQVMVATHQRHPQWLSENFRKYAWHSVEFESKFTAKLTAQLTRAEDTEALIWKVIKILQTFMMPSFFLSSEFCEFIQAIRDRIQTQINPDSQREIASDTQQLSTQIETSAQRLDKLTINVGTHVGKSSWVDHSSGAAIAAEKKPGIAILLLDAENLNLDEETEEFLKKICTYDLQIKIAFANWQRLGKRDVELHSRHYELIHVPAGKDSADVKMATVGSSIFVHYPNAREVFVCSSDGVMTHLCTTLRTHGLTVYLVRKQGKTLSIVNTQTGKSQNYAIADITQIYSLEEWIEKIKDIIKSEQQKTSQQWIKLSRITSLFEENYQLPLEKVLKLYSSEHNLEDIFLNRPADFVIHKLSETLECYLTLFEPNHSITEKREVSPLTDKIKQSEEVYGKFTPISLSSATVFKSRNELEQALTEIVESMQIKYPEKKVSTGTLGAEFKQLYGQKPSSIVKQLGLGNNFCEFLKSCLPLTLNKKGKAYEVAIAKTFLPNLNSREELEQLLVTILTDLIVKSPEKYIPLSTLASECHNQLGLPITQIMKRLKLSGKFHSFLQSCNFFTVKKVGTVYLVTLSHRTQ